MVSELAPAPRPNWFSRFFSGLLHWQTGCAGLSGILMGLSFEPFRLDLLIWVWALPVLTALWCRKNTWRRSFFLGWLSGFVFFTITFWWLTELPDARSANGLALILLPMYLAIYPGIWAAFTGTLGRWPWEGFKTAPKEERGPLVRRSLAVIVLSAGLWTSMDWARDWVMTGFGWNHVGVVLGPYLHLAQLADVVGSLGLAFFVMIVNLGLWAFMARSLPALRRDGWRPWTEGWAAMGCLLFLWGYSEARLRTLSMGMPIYSNNLDVLLVQPNYTFEEKRNRDFWPEMTGQLQQMTLDAMQEKPYDLVVWPESSLPLPFDTDPKSPYIQASGVSEFMEENGRYLNVMLHLHPQTSFMVGADTIDKWDAEGAYPDVGYNSVHLLKGDFANRQFYHKMHLVPFGEFLPFREEFPFLRAWLGKLLPADFNRGKSIEPLRLDQKDKPSLIPMVCFEDTVPRQVRKFVRAEPQLLINMTNDNWFGHSAAVDTQFANARLRSVELRRPLLRCANTGFTCLMDERGVITQELRDPETGRPFTRGILSGTIDLSRASGMTVFARIGDAFSIAWLFLSIGGLVWMNRRRKTEVHSDSGQWTARKSDR